MTALQSRGVQHVASDVKFFGLRKDVTCATRPKIVFSDQLFKNAALLRPSPWLIFQEKNLKSFTLTYKCNQYYTNTIELACPSLALELAKEFEY